MIPAPAFFRYRGDGSVPTGHEPQTRGEQGSYLADPELVVAVNTALAVDQPLLITGEAGTGKTTLAWSVASELGLSISSFYTSSESRARDTLYTIDHLRRLSDAQAGHGEARDPARYIEFEALGRAICDAERRHVVLIDEVDKAPRDFPNDLLNVIEKKEFYVPELAKSFRATHSPIVIITSNSERQLPAPFLRRCVFHHIEPPGERRLQQILQQRLGHLRPSPALVEVAIARFLELRHQDLTKKPTTAELVAWLRALVGAELSDQSVRELAEVPLRRLFASSALIKTKDDQDTLDRLALKGR